MNDLVDCRALATEFIARRPSRDAGFTTALAERFGIDAARTLTEIEGVDVGNVEDWGDLVDIHTLRYVPLERFTPADIGLMLVHAQSPETILPLARLELEQDPLAEGQHYPGDLLLSSARLSVIVALGTYRSIPAASLPDGADVDWIRERVGAAREKLHEALKERAAEEGVGAGRIEAAWQRICEGPPLHRLEWFYNLDDDMNVVAEAAAWLDPPEVMLRTYRRTLYSWPAGRMQIHIVAPADEAEAERTSRHSFWRDTVYEIVRVSGETGVRLVSRSPSAIEDWRGTAFDTVNAARTFASTHFGVGRGDWTSPAPGATGPADHLSLR
jgi:hypothetical protein